MEIRYNYYYFGKEAGTEGVSFKNRPQWLEHSKSQPFLDDWPHDALIGLLQATHFRAGLDYIY